MREGKSTYQQALEDPRWHLRRGAIIWRAKGRCEECGLYVEDDSRLNVHHRYYRAGAKPWEYGDEDLVCLCRDCHEELTDWLERVYRAVGRLPIAAMPQIARYVEKMQTVEFPARIPLAVEDDAA